MRSKLNVVSKSGTNQFHGNVFEFLCNTSLDAKNYFDVNGRGAYHQNQFGGTFGDPIVKDKVFFFADYQGNRRLQAVPQTISGAPSAATLGGDFIGIASSLTGSVKGNAWATALTQQLGQPVSAGEAYYTPTCTTTAQCVFPNAQLSSSHFNPISANLVKYILPAAGSTINSTGTGTFSTSSEEINLKDNKFSGRVDGNSSFGLLSAYYYFDRFDRVDPFWPGNAPLYPGFAIDGKGQPCRSRSNSISSCSTTTASQASAG